MQKLTSLKNLKYINIEFNYKNRENDELLYINYKDFNLNYYVKKIRIRTSEFRTIRFSNIQNLFPNYEDIEFSIFCIDYDHYLNLKIEQNPSSKIKYLYFYCHRVDEAEFYCAPIEHLESII